MKNLQFLEFCFLFFFCNVCNSQTPFVKAWDARFGGSKYEEIAAIIRFDSASFFMLGKSNSDSSGNKTVDSKGNFDYWLTRFDENGTKISDFSFGGNFDDNPAALLLCNDSSLLIGGYSDSDSSGDKSDSTKGQVDIWIVNCDANGNKIWDKTFGGNKFCYLRCMVKTMDGGYLLGGVTDSDSSADVSLNSYGGFDYWIIKIDAAGNKIFDKRYGGNFIDNLTNVIALNDGSFLLSGVSTSDSGFCKSKSNFDPTHNSSDYWIVKIDSLGNQLWDKTIGTVQFDKICYAVQVENNNVLLCGSTDCLAASGDKSVANHNPGWDLWVVKIDASGNKIWDKVYGGQGANEDEITLAFVTRDSNYMFCAASYSQAGFEKSEPNLGLEQSWILKTDTAGNRLTDKTIFTNGHDESCFVIELNDGCLLVANSNFVDNGGYVSQNHISDSIYTNNFGDFWVMKLCDSTYGFVQPMANFASSDTNWCDKLCIDFYDISQNNPTSWQWFFPNAQPDTSTLQNPTGICYNIYGIYDVILIACNQAGCDTVFKQAFIKEFQPPIAPLIYQSNDTLFSSAMFQYVWYEVLNPGVVLSTDSFYVFSLPGQYYVIGIDTNGCMTPSNIVTITSLQAFSNQSSGVALLFNTETNTATIKFEHSSIMKTKLSVMDAEGRIVLSDEIPSGITMKAVNCNRFEQGIYFISLKSGIVSSNFKIIISH